MTAVQSTPTTQFAAAPDLLAVDLAAGVVRVAGDLDRSSAHHLTVAVHALAATRSRVWTIDLHDLAFCDAGGLRALEGARELARSRQCVLRLLSVPALVAQLLPLVAARAAEG